MTTDSSPDPVPGQASGVGSPDASSRRGVRSRTMQTITVRKPTFDWPTDLPLLPFPDDVSRSCEMVAGSFTLPYVEPYLIRTMRVAAKEVEDPQLAADMKAFSQQEAQHFKNHAAINDIVRAQLSPAGAEAMRALEDGLEADYRRFTDTKSLAFNLAYAEGFEATALHAARSIRIADTEAIDRTWGDLWYWHLAEEIEHRTVIFDAYDHIVGRYAYRTAVGSWGQAHFLGFALRMAAVLQSDHYGEPIPLRRVAAQSAKRSWAVGTVQGGIKALLPNYNPRKVEIDDESRVVASMYGVELD